MDKSVFIDEFLSESAEISLVTRPRRFGKTLNLSMLRYFFDLENHSESRKLFENLQIGQNDEAMRKQGSRPVIAEFSTIFRHLVAQSFSYFDVGGKNPESFYHTFTMGLMVQFSDLWTPTKTPI